MNTRESVKCKVNVEDPRNNAREDHWVNIIMNGFCHKCGLGEKTIKEIKKMNTTKQEVKCRGCGEIVLFEGDVHIPDKEKVLCGKCQNDN